MHHIQPSANNVDVPEPVRSTTGVLFILQPHFSLLTFSGAADALVTANLVCGNDRYRVDSISCAASPVISDIGISLAVESPGELSAHDLPAPSLDGIDLAFVCGGYRCSVEEDPALSRLLRQANERGIALGGLWNGAVALAHAGLLDGHDCTVHPEDRASLGRRFPKLRIRRRAVVVDRNRFSAAGPGSALELMLALITRREDSATSRAVRDILVADAQGNGDAAFAEDDERSLPPALSSALELMRNNLDEPLSRKDLAFHVGLSARSLERLFNHGLGVSPARHYLDLRLQRAAELLNAGGRSIAEVADACGFADTAPFSRSFARHFGFSPRAWRRRARNQRVR